MYRTWLYNGRFPGPEIRIHEGERLRLAAATPFRMSVAGHPMTVTHADGRPIRPVEVDSLPIAVGERYDVVIEASNPGAWNLMAASAGDTMGGARAVLRYRDSRQNAPPEGQMPDGLRSGRALTLRDLDALERSNTPPTRPDRTFDLALSGGMMMEPGWSIEGQADPESEPIEIREGELESGMARVIEYV